MRLIHVALAFSVGFAGGALAQDATDDPVAQTQRLLKDSAQREAAIKGDSQAQQADTFAKRTMGNDPAKTQKVYDVSSQIMGDLAAKSQNDPVKMQQTLDRALKDPQAFFNNLSPDEQNQIRQLSSQIGDSKP